MNLFENELWRLRFSTLGKSKFDIAEVQHASEVLYETCWKGRDVLGKVVHDIVLSPSINRTRVHGCLCGVSVCVVPQNVRNSTLRQLWGTHCMKTVEEEGPGWWVGTLWCPCGAPLTNERRMPVELCIGGNKRSRKSILLLVTAPEVRNVRNSTLWQLRGSHYTETVEEEGPGGGWANWGVHAVRRWPMERRMPVELCIRLDFSTLAT